MKAIYLISCVSQKQSKACAARDLYISNWFRKSRRYAEASGCLWYILSAEHGLIEPDLVVEPYNLTRNANGLFLRNLGWKRTPTGYTQHKFYLGRDESTAMMASLRLEEVWKQVEHRWERTEKMQSVGMKSSSGTSSLETGPSGHSDLIINGLPASEGGDGRRTWNGKRSRSRSPPQKSPPSLERRRSRPTRSRSWKRFGFTPRRFSGF